MTSTLPKPLFANRNRRASIEECPKSFPSKPLGSRNAVLASSNETPCFSWLCLAFLESHSKINYVYTKYFPAARYLVDVVSVGMPTTRPPSAHQCSIGSRLLLAFMVQFRNNIFSIDKDIVDHLELLRLGGATVLGLTDGIEGIGRWTQGSKPGTWTRQQAAGAFCFFELSIANQGYA